MWRIFGLFDLPASFEDHFIIQIKMLVCSYPFIAMSTWFMNDPKIVICSRRVCFAAIINIKINGNLSVTIEKSDGLKNIMVNAGQV